MSEEHDGRTRQNREKVWELLTRFELVDPVKHAIDRKIKHHLFNPTETIFSRKVADRIFKLWQILNLWDKIIKTGRVEKDNKKAFNMMNRQLIPKIEKLKRNRK